MKTGNNPDIIVVGGGQAGLAVGYYLKKAGADFLILDKESVPGGAWLHGWDSLRLFSPASYSSLPGTMMPPTEGGFPPRDHVIQYLRDYEARYRLPVLRPVQVTSVSIDADKRFLLETTQGIFSTAALISATGTWSNPFIPEVPGTSSFAGEILHSAEYRSPDAFTGQRVAVIGGGNSGAQILAEISNIADTLWITEHPPRFLPDGIDGRHLFVRATETYKALTSGEARSVVRMLGSIVVTGAVAEARDRGFMKALPPFSEFFSSGAEWPDGSREYFDTIIWCTGFRPALGHLHSLDIFAPNGRIPTEETRSLRQQGLWLVGYGGWTGYASATLIGVGRTARTTAAEALAFIRSTPS